MFERLISLGRMGVVVLAFQGFGLSLLVHLGTFFGTDPLTDWPVFSAMLGLALFPFVIPTILRVGFSRLEGGDQDPHVALFGKTALDDAKPDLNDLTSGTDAERDRAELALVRRFRPNPLIVGIGFLLGYAAFNFVVTMSLLEGGTPEQQGDSYVSTSHGEVLRELTPAEYRWQRAYEARLLSAALMFLWFGLGAAWTERRR